MDFWDLTKLLVRRWYVSLPLMLSALAGTALLVVNIEPDHILTTYVVLVPPPGATEETAALQATNPWLSLGSALAESAKLSIEGEDVVDGLKDQGLSDTYTVTVNPFSPIIDLEIVGDSPSQATSTANRLISLLDHNVQDLQETQGAQPGTFTVVRQLPGIKLEESDSKVKRAAVAVGAAGLLLACALTIMIDALVRRRNRRRTTRAAPAARRYVGRQPVPAAPPRMPPTGSVQPPSNPGSNDATASQPIVSGPPPAEPAPAEPAPAETADSVDTTESVDATAEPATLTVSIDPPASEDQAAAQSPNGTSETPERTLAVFRSGPETPADDSTVILVPPASPAVPAQGSRASGKRPSSKRRGPHRR